jgi:hypothetical protein
VKNRFKGLRTEQINGPLFNIGGIGLGDIVINPGGQRAVFEFQHFSE